MGPLYIHFRFTADMFEIPLYLTPDKSYFSSISPIVHHVTGAQLRRLSPVDAHTVALKPLMGK